MFQDIIGILKDLFMLDSKSSSIVGLTQLKAAKDPVKKSVKVKKNNKDIKISDLMRGSK